MQLLQRPTGAGADIHYSHYESRWMHDKRRYKCSGIFKTPNAKKYKNNSASSEGWRFKLTDLGSFAGPAPKLMSCFCSMMWNEYCCSGQGCLLCLTVCLCPQNGRLSVSGLDSPLSSCTRCRGCQLSACKMLHSSAARKLVKVLADLKLHHFIFLLVSHDCLQIVYYVIIFQGLLWFKQLQKQI